MSGRPDRYGKRGFLAFTSATGARRGAPHCTVTATGKFAVRGLAQSVAKEFKEQDIHVRLPRAAFARCAELSGAPRRFRMRSWTR